MKDFWLSSGHHLADRDPATGGLLVTDDLLRAWLARPEIVPPEEACGAERELHARLLRSPRGIVGARELEVLADADARSNWGVFLAFRDRLLAHPTLEAAYLALARGGVGRTPPVLVDQLAQLVLRNALDGCADPLALRAAELFFRPQRVSFHEGAVLLADDETVERHAKAGPPPTPLLRMFGGRPHPELDVLGENNGDLYWGRSDAFDTVLDFRPGRPALARALERWIAHLLGVEAKVTPQDAIRDGSWAWFVGLDAEATRIGNALWRGEDVSEATLARVLALFRLDLPGTAPVLDRARGRPVWLILAMDEGRRLRVKPQNLLAGLPLPEAA